MHLLEHALTTGAPLASFDDVRRRMILDHCKWDPQVGDVSTLCLFPLLLDRAAADRLNGWAEALTRESLAAEQELLRIPGLLHLLAVPRPLRAVLRGEPTPAAARVMRFDFHPTATGWRLSEVNADVPGGFTEATEFPRLMAEHYDASPAGSPGHAWADAILSRVPDAPTGALLYAEGFTEDLQVVSYLSGLLRRRGARALLAQPRHLRWHDGRAHLDSEFHRGPLDFVVRFFQAEWLPRLPRRVVWQPLVADGLTPVANPGVSVLLESKRFPLTWEHLSTPLPTWRALLPETIDPSRADWRRDDRWMVKAAYSNTGDEVYGLAITSPREWRKAARWVRWTRNHWIAQERFDARPIETPLGPMNVCIGVYTIDGRAAGMYGRLSREPVVNYRAMDAAVLVT